MTSQITENFVKSKIQLISEALKFEDIDPDNITTARLSLLIVEFMPKMYADGNNFLIYDSKRGVWFSVYAKDAKLYKIIMMSLNNIIERQLKKLESEMKELNTELKNLKLEDKDKKPKIQNELKGIVKQRRSLMSTSKVYLSNRFITDLCTMILNNCPNASDIYRKNQTKNKFRIFYKNRELVDISTGKIFKTKATSYCMSRIPFNFLGFDEPTPNADKFILQLANNNAERAECIKSILGYSITNLNDAKKMFVFYGKEGNNGKSVLMNLMEEILKEKCKPISKELLIECKSSTATANPELLALRNVTLGVLSELKDNEKLNETVFKSITGGDVLTARQLYSNKVESFDLVMKIILHSNKPVYIDMKDKASVNRLYVVYFDAEFVDNPTEEHHFKKDPLFLKKFIKNHGDEFFTMLVKYARQYLEKGIVQNEAVNKDTERYLNMIDPVHQFVNSTYEDSKDSIEYFNDIWGDFKTFCTEKGMPFTHQNQQKTKLLQYLSKNYKKIKQSNKLRRGDMTAFKGLRNLNNVEEEEFGFDEIEDNDITLCQNMGRLFKVYSFDPKGFTSTKELKEEFHDISDITKLLKNMNIPEIKRSIMGFRLTKIINEEPEPEPEPEPKEEIKETTSKAQKPKTQKLYSKTTLSFQ